MLEKIVPKDINLQKNKDKLDQFEGFIFMKPISSRRVRLYYPSDAQEIVDYLSMLGSDEIPREMLNTEYWSESKSCRPKFRVHLIMNEGRLKFGRPRVNLRKTMFCPSGTCPAGRQCKKIRNFLGTGHMCKCRSNRNTIRGYVF
jgi:hypothetical protein